MKSFLAMPSIFSLLLAVSLSSAQASHLRPECGPCADPEEFESQSRFLQGSSERNADLLNSLIRAVLPSINSAIEQNVPDPLELNLDSVYDLGSVDLGCGDPVSAGFTFSLGGINGLSEIFIDTLEVVPGSDSVTGCLNQPWSATFNMAIATLGTLAVNELGGAFQASACGLTLDEGVGGNILTTNASLAGLVELGGDLCAGVLTINTANILDTLAVGFSSITAELTEVPAVFSDLVNDVTTALSSALSDELSNFIEPTIRPIIQEQLNGASTFAPATLLPIQASLIRNNAQDRIEGFIDAGAQLLGWGGDDDV